MRARVLATGILLSTPFPQAVAQPDTPTGTTPTVELDQRLDARLAYHAKQARTELADRVLPFWSQMADRYRGGFNPGWDLTRSRVRGNEVSVVSQAGLTYAFAHALEAGLAPVEVDPLWHVRHGLKFLLGPCRDLDRGGFYDRVSLAGGVTSDAKRTEVQAAAIVALVEAFRVTGDDAALDAAMETFRLVTEHLRDRSAGGWFEGANGDWSRAGEGSIKRAETHLAVLQAFTALAGVSSDADVKGELAHALTIVRERFYPSDPGRAKRRATSDWLAVSGELEYGPVVYALHATAARAVGEAQVALGREVAWDRVRALLEHATAHLAQSGPGAGVALMGYAGQPVLAEPRVWWAQAEVISGLAWAIDANPSWREDLGPTLAGVLDWYANFQIDAATGIPVAVVGQEGEPIVGTLAGAGKFGMLDVRARAWVVRMGSE
jgi:mannobiose 2-epimerase